MKQRQSEHLPTLRPMVSFTETFQSSQNDRQQKFTLDKTLARGINQNNSSIIIPGHNESSGMQDQTLHQDEEVNRILFQFRLKYDKVKTESVTLQKKIAHGNEELKRLQQEYQMLNNNKHQANKSCKKAQNELGIFTYDVEQLLMDFECQKAMEERLKSDILYYKKKTFDFNLELMKKKSEIKRHSNQSTRQKKLSIRCQNLLTSVEDTLNKNQIERQDGIETVKEVLCTKKEQFFKQKQRGYELERSMEAVLSEKLPQERQQIRLFYANKLLKRILHFKMQSQMKKYSQASSSFSQIKSNTTVKAVDEFVYKFLNKNEIYGNLLESISKLEPKIETLKEQRKILEDQRVHLNIECEEIAEIFKNKHETSSQKSIQDMERLTNRLQVINKLRNSWMNWALSTVSMFRAVPRSQIRPKYQYLGTLLGDSLRMILKQISTAEEEKDVSISEQAFSKQVTRTKIQPQDLLTRNIRIKTLGNDHSHRDDDQAEYDLTSEKDYLHLARKVVKKQRYARNKILSKA